MKDVKEGDRVKFWVPKWGPERCSCTFGSYDSMCGQHGTPPSDQHVGVLRGILPADNRGQGHYVVVSDVGGVEHVVEHVVHEPGST